MKRLALCVLLAFALLQTASAQLLPRGSDVNIYFPEMVDGGQGDWKWQTAFTFLNPDSSTSASIRLWLLAENGSYLPIDFGSGPSSYFTLTVPPGGSRTIVSLRQICISLKM